MKEIGIKLADGSFYPILSDFVRTQKLELTTVRDNQETVQIDLFQNSEELEYIGSLIVENISKKDAGDSTIELSLEVDDDNNLKAEATDADTGAHQELKVSLSAVDTLSSSDDFNLKDFDSLNSENKIAQSGEDTILEDSPKAKSKLPLLIIAILGVIGLVVAVLLLSRSCSSKKIVENKKIKNEVVSTGNTTEKVPTPSSQERDKQGSTSTSGNTSQGNTSTSGTSSQGSTGTSGNTSQGNTSTSGTSSQGSTGTSGTSSQGSTSTSGTSSQGSISTSGTTSQGNTSTSGTSSQGNTSTSGTTSQGSASTSGTSSQGSTSTSGTSSQGSTSTSGTSSQGSTSTSGTTSQGSTSTSGTNSQGSTSTSGTSSQGNTSTSGNRLQTNPDGSVRYLLQWGDTLWDLAETFYKNPWDYVRIVKHNNIKNPNLIIAGTYIDIPSK